MNYSILQELITNLKDFEDEKMSKSIKMEDFVVFLNQKYLGNLVSDKPSIDVNAKNDENNIGQLIAFMYRYAKGYIKKALEESTLLTLDDFGYLAAIWQDGDLTKTQLIEKNIHEKNTGMEIIKRLISNNLLEQYNDLEDKRSKRLKITPLGQSELFKSFDGMLKVSQIIAGKLTSSEKIQLFYLLNKLHDFHNPIFLNEKEASVDKILEKYF
jgi:MarR family transcriptional regulator, lower aerobic nicotinate degradation pathway regulator